MTTMNPLTKSVRPSAPPRLEHEKGTWEAPRDPLGFRTLQKAWDDPLALFADGARNHGAMVRFSFGWIRYFFVNDPRAAHRVLVENAKNYTKSVNYQGLKVVLGNGLLTAEGEPWKKHRKLAQPAFHRDRLEEFARTMSACTADVVARWEETIAATGVPFDLHAEMTKLTFRIVGKTLLGTDLENEAQAFGDALYETLCWANAHVESVVRIPPWMPTPKNRRFRAAQRTIEAVIARVIQERKESGELGTDLLGMLMAARDEASGEPMSDRQLMDEVLTLVLAGHETTANALAFTFYLLSKHPDVARRLAREADTVLEGRLPSLDDLPRLAYTKAVAEESMRLFPPAWVVERQSVAEDDLVGYALPKNVTVAVSPYMMHRNPALWPNPEGFDPERFMTPDPNRHKLAYLPFGAGPRFCIGNAFAMMELQIILPMLARMFRLELVPGFRLELEPSITLRPRHGIEMRAFRRAPPADA